MSKDENLSFVENEAASNLEHQTLDQLLYTFDILNDESFTQISYFILPGGGAFAYPIKKDVFLQMLMEELAFRGAL